MTRVAIAAVLFDMMQTLGSSAQGFREAEKEAERAIFACLGLSDWDEFLDRYRRLRSEFHAASRFSREELWEEMFHQYGRKADRKRLVQWADRYWSIVEARLELFPETGKILARLAGRYRLAVVTNTQRRGSKNPLNYALFSGLAVRFETIVIAGEGGIPPKPAPEAFQECLRRMDLQPAQAVFVGDDWEIDIQGALRVGMRAVWLRHRRVDRVWPFHEDSQVPVLDSLDGLLKLDRLLP